MLTVIQRRPFCFAFLSFLISWTSISSDAERLFHQRDHSDLQSSNQHRARPITDPHTAELFLSRYGFLKPVKWEERLYEEPEEPEELEEPEEPDFPFLEFQELNIEEGSASPRSRDADLQTRQKLRDPQFTAALRDFQTLSGLPVTGELDEATKDAMNRPRCGVPDVEAEAEYSEEDLENSESENLEKLENLGEDFENSVDSSENSQNFNNMNNTFENFSNETDSKMTNDFHPFANHINFNNGTGKFAIETSDLENVEIENLEKVENLGKNFENSVNNSSEDYLQNFKNTNSDSNEEMHSTFTNNFDPVANNINFDNRTGKFAIETSDIENVENFKNSSEISPNFNNINNTFQNFSNETDLKMTNDFHTITNRTNFDNNTGKFAIQTSDLENVEIEILENVENLDKNFETSSSSSSGDDLPNFNDKISNSNKETHPQFMNNFANRTDFHNRSGKFAIEISDTEHFDHFDDLENSSGNYFENLNNINNTFENFSNETDSKMTNSDPIAKHNFDNSTRKFVNETSKMDIFDNFKNSSENSPNLNNITHTFHVFSNETNSKMTDFHPNAKHNFDNSTGKFANETSDMENLYSNFENSSENVKNIHNTFDNFSNETNSKMSNKFYPIENRTSINSSGKMVNEITNIDNLNTTNFENETAFYFGGSDFYDFENETVLNLTNLDPTGNTTITNVLQNYDTEKRDTEIKEMPPNNQSKISNYKNLKMTFGNVENLNETNLNSTGNFYQISNISQDNTSSSDATVTETEFGEPLIEISHLQNSKMGNLNKSSDQTYNSSVNLSLNFNATRSSHNNNLNSTRNFYANLNNTNLTQSTENYPADLDLNNFSNEAVSIFNETNSNSSNKFDQFSNNTAVGKRHQNRTEYPETEIDFSNETILNSTAIFDPISNDTTREIMRPNSADIKATEPTQNFVLGDLNFTNFSNEANSTASFDAISNDAGAESLLRNTTDKKAFETSDSTMDNFKFRLDLNLNPTDNYTETENMQQNSPDKRDTEIKNSTVDVLNSRNFLNETNQNSADNFDPISSDATKENLTLNRTEKEAFQINFFTKIDSNSSTNLDETSKNSTTGMKNDSNSSSSFDQISNDTNNKENMLQNRTEMSIKTTNSTLDALNLRNYSTFANNFDPISNYTTTENMHRNSTDKRATETKNSTVNFDQISNGATKENLNLNSTEKEAFQINFFNKIDLNSSTNLDKIDNEATTEMNNTDKIKNETIELENVNSTTSFDQFINDTTAENMLQNRTEIGIKTSNSTTENLLQNSDEISKKYFTVHDPNFPNFLNETNQNSTIDFDPSGNKTTNKTQQQNVDKPGQTEITEPGGNRGGRGLASVLPGRRRSRREAGGHGAFSKSVLRWRLMGEGYSSQLSVEEQRYVFRLAFRMWSEVCPLEFIEDTASPLDQIDIRLGFGTGRHLGCQQRFDGSGREFAHAWFLGDIHFDDDEHFTGPTAGKGISLLKVAVHEIGHVLGLPHIHRPGSIMQPSYLPHESSFEVDWMDRRAIQDLYGGCRGRFDTVFDWIRRERTASGEVVIRFNTYFMRQGWYWLYENRNNRTRYGDPVSLQSGWRGLPLSGVDGFVHVWSRRTDRVYFFKGSQFWRYDSDQDQVFRRDPEGVTYPRPISEGFPGVPAPIDTAVFDRRDGHIYFFKGALVFAFSLDSSRVVRGFPKRLRSMFPPLDPRDHPESHLDAAYFSYSHNALFLFKGTSFWQVTSGRDRRRRPHLPKNALLPHRPVHEHWFDICDVHPTSLRLNP